MPKVWGAAVAVLLVAGTVQAKKMVRTSDPRKMVRTDSKGRFKRSWEVKAVADDPRRYFGDRRPSPVSRGDFHTLLDETFREEGSSAVVIGANNGDTNDPVWRAFLKFAVLKKVFVEPIPTIFDQLVENAQREQMVNATYVQAAIVPYQWVKDGKPGDGSASIKMYCWNLKGGALDSSLQEHLPRWLSQVCSISRERLYADPADTAKLTITPEMIRTQIKEYNIPAMSVRSLVEKHVRRVKSVAYVQVDAEGYDYDVVMQFPFHWACFKPRIIVYENMLLTMDKRNEIYELLASNGYERVDGGWKAGGTANDVYMFNGTKEQRVAACKQKHRKKRRGGHGGLGTSSDLPNGVLAEGRMQEDAAQEEMPARLNAVEERQTEQGRRIDEHQAKIAELEQTLRRTDDRIEELLRQLREKQQKLRDKEVTNEKLSV